MIFFQKMLRLDNIFFRYSSHIWTRLINTIFGSTSITFNLIFICFEPREYNIAEQQTKISTEIESFTDESIKVYLRQVQKGDKIKAEKVKLSTAEHLKLWTCFRCEIVSSRGTLTLSSEHLFMLMSYLAIDQLCSRPLADGIELLPT